MMEEMCEWIVNGGARAVFVATLRASGRNS